MAQSGESRHPVPPLLRHRLLLGDWSGWMRDPIDLLRVTYAAGFVAAALGGSLPGAARKASSIRCSGSSS
jgi:hypothetical protein